MGCDCVGKSLLAVCIVDVFYSPLPADLLGSWTGLASLCTFEMLYSKMATAFLLFFGKGVILLSQPVLSMYYLSRLVVTPAD